MGRSGPALVRRPDWGAVVRYVLKEDWDDIEQRCLADDCDYVNPVFEEPRRFCLRCHGPLGAFPAYGTEAERSKRLPGMDHILREYR